MDENRQVSGEQPVAEAVTRGPHAAPGAGQLAPRARPADADPLRVLAIGRTEVYAALVRHALDGLHTRIDTAPDEDAARDHLAQRRYGLIVLLLPITAGAVDGLEVCRRLREAEGYAPLLILDAVGDTDDVITGFEAGADAYLVEPIEAEEVRARLAALLRRHGPARHPALSNGATQPRPTAHMLPAPTPPRGTAPMAGRGSALDKIRGRLPRFIAAGVLIAAGARHGHP